jgi:HK97 gp10 family phage protein
MPTGGVVATIGLKETEAFFQKVAADARKAGVTGLKKAAYLVERSAKRKAPVDRGGLRASIATAVDEGHLRAEVGPTVVYGRIRELGGTIVPVRAKMLAWQSPRGSGNWVFAKRVKQAGTPYMGPALDENVEKIRDELGIAVSALITDADRAHPSPPGTGGVA